MIRSQVVILSILAFAVVALRAIGEGGLWGDVRTQSSEAAAPVAALIGIALFVLIGLPVFWAYSKRLTLISMQLPLLLQIAAMFGLQFYTDTLMSDDLQQATKLAAEAFNQVLFNLTIVYCMRAMPHFALRTASFTLVLTNSFALVWLLFFNGGHSEWALIGLT